MLFNFCSDLFWYFNSWGSASCFSRTSGGLFTSCVNNLLFGEFKFFATRFMRLFGGRLGLLWANWATLSNSFSGLSASNHLLWLRYYIRTFILKISFLVHGVYIFLLINAFISNISGFFLYFCFWFGRNSRSLSRNLFNNFYNFLIWIIFWWLRHS